MRWPWHKDLTRVSDRLDREIMALRTELETAHDHLDQLRHLHETRLLGLESTVHSWEKAVLLAQVMQPQPLPPDVPPIVRELPDAVEKALRRRAQPGTSTYLEMAEDAARQLADGLEPDLVIEDQLRGARPKVW